MAWAGASHGKTVGLHVNESNSFFQEDFLMCARLVQCSLGSAYPRAKATVPENIEPGELFKDTTWNLLIGVNSWKWQQVFQLCAFFFPFIFISWRLITSQHCSGFCQTLTWISHGDTCIPHPIATLSTCVILDRTPTVFNHLCLSFFLSF